MRKSCAASYEPTVHPRPHRIDWFPQEYFTALLAEVSRHAAHEGRAARRPWAREAANEPFAHGYPPFRGLPALRGAIAARSSALHGVELDPHSEITIVKQPSQTLILTQYFPTMASHALL
jgi:hypothetical protein